MAIVIPNGLFDVIFDGIPAVHRFVFKFDLEICRLKSLLSYLPPTDHRFVYGDAAFGSQDCVLGPYKRAGNRVLTPSQRLGELNQWLSTKRIMHGFGGVKQNFKLLHLRTSLVTGLCPVGRYMPAFAFIYNCRTCMRGGNQISEMFDLLPPSIEEYTSGNIEVREVPVG